MAIVYLENDPFAIEYYLNLKEKEADIPPFYAKSPQLRSRRTLVDWLAVIHDIYELCPTTRQLSVTLLDMFMDNYAVDDRILKLVALGCLLVAAKFEEKEQNIPKAASLNNYVPRPAYELREYMQMELTVLRFFQWKISIPTPAHFVEYFMQYSVLPTDLHEMMPIEDFGRVREYVSKYNNYFLEITLQDEYFRRFRPSLIAAACICCSRIALSIYPPWPSTLAAASDLPWTMLEEPVDKMYKTYEVDVEAQRQRDETSTPVTSAGAAGIDSTGNSPNSNASSSPDMTPQSSSSPDMTPQSTYFLRSRSKVRYN